MHVKDYFGIWRWRCFIPSLCLSLGLLAAYRVWLWVESKDLGFPVAPPLQTSQEEKNLIQYCNRWALEFTSFPAAIHPHTTSLFAVTTLDFRSPSNLFVLLQHYCDPTWKQQLLLLFANIFISSPAAMLSWWNRCLRGSLLCLSRRWTWRECKARAAKGKPRRPFPSWLPKWCRQTVCKATRER